jgi:polyribonucleotide nucleotidyltransferase
VFDVCYIFLARLGCLSSSVSIWHYSPLTRAEKSSQAIRLGQEAIAQQCAAIEVWAADLGKEKRTEDLKSPPEGLDEIITQQIGAEIEDAYRTISLKKVRGEAVAIIKEKVKESLILADGETQETHPGKYDATTVSMALKRVESRIMRNLVLREGYRADGRGIRDVRPIWSRASMLPRTHGAYHPPYDLILPALIVVSACVHRQKPLV